jgi:hypothetical protein
MSIPHHITLHQQNVKRLEDLDLVLLVLIGL